jgi:ATP/maltotriose-dependent transcriptional regulator MalT
VLVEALAHGRAIERMNQGDIPGAVHDARRALELAGELGDAPSRLLALTSLSATSCYSGDTKQALDCARQAAELLAPDIPGDVARWCHYALAQVLTEIGELGSARQVCAAGLTLSRQVDDLAILVPLLGVMVDLDRRSGDLAAAGTHLREAIGLAARIGHNQGLANMIEQCVYLCAEARRWADAATLWAALDADDKRRGASAGPVSAGGRAEYLRRMEQALAPDQLREAEARGSRLPLPAAAELAIMVTSEAQHDAPARGAGKLLSRRERELIGLVAQGHTNAEIAARLYISVRTVASHLDRIRDKTGYRRRADLTRLAIAESLV